MASGFSGSGDFYSPAAGSAMINNNLQLQQYRSQLAHDPISPQMFPPRRNGGADFVVKRSLAEFERQQQQLQQQVGLLRSVKQRSQYNHTSPISPLSPFDFSPDSTARYGHAHGRPFIQHQQQHQQQPVVRSQQLVTNPGLSSSNLSFSQVIVPNKGLGLETEEKKMKNRLQELEKQLLDDNDDDSTDVASVVTSSEWSETMQNLMTTPSQTSNQTQNQTTQMPFSASPTSSSSSSSCSSSTSSLICPSSKHSLIEAATAFSDGNSDVGTAILDRLKQASNTRGDPEQRLTAYMVSALRSRLNPIENPPPVTELSNPDHIVATQKLYEASPCFKLGFMVANIASLESTIDQPDNVHVLDFDVGQGSQYATLIHALAERQSGKPTMVKISTLIDPSTTTTGINNSAKEEERLKHVGDFLRKLAERVGVGLKFNVVASKINDLNRESLGCEPNEALVVNFSFRLHRMPDESVSTENPRDELLRLVKGLSPRVVTLVEQEMNCNTAPFVARVAETTSYYQALFDSLDATMTRDGSDRVRIEECLGRKAANSVACEGRDRTERCEVFGKWRARMGMAGFVLKPLGQHVAESMRAKLNSAYRNSNSGGFTVKEENGAVSFGWKGRALTVVSAWR